jgi:hypothetical protein
LGLAAQFLHFRGLTLNLFKRFLLEVLAPESTKAFRILLTMIMMMLHLPLLVFGCEFRLGLGLFAEQLESQDVGAPPAVAQNQKCQPLRRVQLDERNTGGNSDGPDKDKPPSKLYAPLSLLK